MKMISKLGFAVLLAATVTGAATAQFYGGIHAGYNIPTASGVLGTSTTGNTSTGNTSNIYGTSGGNTNFGINVGYMFSEHFGFDLGADYIIATPVVTSKQTDNGNTTNTNATTTVSGTQVRVIPSLVVSAGGEGIKPYGRFGIVLPVAGETITTVKSATTVGSVAYNTTDVTASTAGSLSVGFNTAIGVNVALGEKLTLFGEVALTTLTIKAATNKLTAYSSTTLGVTTNLSDLKTIQKETNFVDKLDSSSNNSSYGTPNPDKA